MPRHARKNYETSFFHIIVQGINREYIFNEVEDIEKYLKIIENNLSKSEIRIISYCIMNNHAHFLIYAEDIAEMSKFMLKTNTSFAKYYNKKRNRVGYVFRDRYISEPIMNERYLISCINYIHKNPVKANMVKKCSDYKYSSYNNFLKDKTIKSISKIININLDTKLFIGAKIEEDFLDVDIDRNELILEYINKFRKDNGIKLVQIYEDRRILKKLIEYLKFTGLIKYTEIMRIMDIPKGVMEHLKSR